MTLGLGVRVSGVQGLGFHIGALIIRIGVPLKGVYKGSIVGFHDIGASIIRMGFWGALYYNHIYKPPQ